MYLYDEQLEPTQDLYLNLVEGIMELINAFLEPTQDLYLNSNKHGRLLVLQFLEPTQDLYLNSARMVPAGKKLYSNRHKICI